MRGGIFTRMYSCIFEVVQLYVSMRERVKRSQKNGSPEGLGMGRKKDGNG